MAYHRRPKGKPFDVELQLEDPEWAISKQRSTAAQHRGNRYEAKMQREFLRRYSNYCPKPWLSYCDSSLRRNWCQPDGLLFDPWNNLIVAVECKYKHIVDAWIQLFCIYRPVLRALFPLWRIECVEVCAWYDPAVAVPEAPKLCEFPEKPWESRFNVHILKA